MQDIADEDGISRTALHYYLGNKNKYSKHFLQMLSIILFQKSTKQINKELPLTEKLWK
jgi:predicted DNA-binding protein YlxM (UPF0122 family)